MPLRCHEFIFTFAAQKTSCKYLNTSHLTFTSSPARRHILRDVSVVILIAWPPVSYLSRMFSLACMYDELNIIPIMSNPHECIVFHLFYFLLLALLIQWKRLMMSIVKCLFVISLPTTTTNKEYKKQQQSDFNG